MNILVNRTQPTDGGIVATVQVDDNLFSVTVDEKLLEELNAKSAEALIVASFRFLLDREPIGSILSEFNLDVIEKYFPEYKQTIKQYY